MRKRETVSVETSLDPDLVRPVGETESIDTAAPSLPGPEGRLRGQGSEARPVVLEFRDVVKRYGKSEAVRGVNLKMYEGELVTLLGPSGSGKTTLLKLVAGFIEITEGQLLLRGQDISPLSPADRQIGMVFQNYALFPHLTVEENIAYPLKIRKWAPDVRADRVEEMLQLVGLPGLAGRLPRELSGGQQQRVALARALSFGPSLLLMDEPLGALDRELRERMMVELRRIQEEVGVTTLYVTHDREEALTLADRIGIMRDGLLQGIGTSTELLSSPPSRFIASFFGGHALLPAHLESVGEQRADAPTRASVTCLGQSIHVSLTGDDLGSGGEVSVVVPANSLSDAPSGSDEQLSISARVLDVLDLGDRLRVTCLVSPGGSEEDVILRVSGDRLIKGHAIPGTDITLYSDTQKLIVVAGRGTP